MLMALAFANPSTESTQKFLPENPGSDTPLANQTLVTLESTGGVTISLAQRGLIGAGQKATTVQLPSAPSALNSTMFLSEEQPFLRSHLLLPVALIPLTLDSFINADGTIKKGLNWFSFSQATGMVWPSCAD